MRDHSFDPHRKAVQRMSNAVRQLDTHERSIRRRADMFPAERQKQLRENREKWEREARAGLADLRAAAAADAASLGKAEKLTGQAAQRRQYWATVAQQELSTESGRRGALGRVKALLKAGDREAAREYLRLASPVVPAERSGELARVRAACMTDTERVDAAFGQAFRVVEARIPDVERHLVSALEKAGGPAHLDGPDDGQWLASEVAGPPIDRGINLWMSTVQEQAVGAAEAEAGRVAAAASTVEGGGLSDGDA